MALHLGNLLAQQARWSDAASAYDVALEASERLYEASLLRNSLEAEPLERGDLFLRAGYVLAKAGRLDDAVTTLESGRVRTLSNTLARDRALRERVGMERPDLLDEYEACAAEMRSLEVQEVQAPVVSSYQVVSLAGMERARNRLRALIEQLGEASQGLEFSRTDVDGCDPQGSRFDSHRIPRGNRIWGYGSDRRG